MRLREAGDEADAEWEKNSRHEGIEVPQRVFRDPCGFVALRYVILKFLRVNLFLFRVHKCFLQMIKNFS